MSATNGEIPEFFHHLTPATQLMVQRRLDLGDIQGTDFLMSSESADTRRKYELWKMREGLMERNIPITKSGPSRIGVEIWEAERQERRKQLNKMLYRNDHQAPMKKEEIIYESKIRIEIPLTVLIPTEKTREVTTATAILGLRSDYY